MAEQHLNAFLIYLVSAAIAAVVFLAGHSVWAFVLLFAGWVGAAALLRFGGGQ
jgi:hypothetical protein